MVIRLPGLFFLVYFPYDDKLQSTKPSHSLFKEGDIMNRQYFACAFFTILMTLSFQPTLAQDQLGIFFDEEGTTNSITTSSPYSQISAWVQLTNPTADESITGFEFRVEVGSDGPDPILVWQLPATAINILDEPSFMVGLGTPLAIEPRVTLAEVTIVVPEAGQTVWLTLHPVAQPSLLDPPGYGYPVCHPIYAYGDGNSYLAMPPNSSCESAPVASINHSGEPPQYLLSELPPVVAFYSDKDNEATGSLVLVNHGPVSYSGVISSTGTTPVQFEINDHYYTSDPTSFQVPIGGSVRFTPDYSGADFVDAVLQLEICGDIWQVPVLSEDDLQRCEWSTELLDFGEVPVGEVVILEVELTNTGYEDLIVPTYLNLTPFLVVVVGQNVNPLEPGQSCTYEVRFHSSLEGEYSQVVQVEGLCSLSLTATAFLGPPECFVSLPSLNFDDFYMGANSDSEYFYIQNVGGGVLEGSIALIDTTGAFQFTSWVNPTYSLTQNMAHYIYVEFDPPAPGYYSAEIDLGSDCGSIPVTGLAIEAGPICQLSGYRYEDGVLTVRSIPVGGYRTDYLKIRNIGGGFLEGNVTLEDTTGTFEVFYGGEYSLPHNRYHYVGVKFSPQEVGVVSTVLHTGSICGDVLVVGEGLEPYEDCYSYFYNNDFSRVAVGDTAYTSIHIHNSGFTELHGDLMNDGESFELMNPGPFTLPVGQYMHELFMFIPQTVGEHFTTVSTGLDSCPGNWEVTGFAVPAGSDRIGFYTDPEGTTNTLQTLYPKARETVYVVLQNPSAGEILNRWYLNYWTNGPAMVMDDWTTSLPGELGGYYYSKYFEADSPIPMAETMVLAEFSVLVHDHTLASNIIMGYAYYMYDGGYPNYVMINNPGDLHINSSKSMVANLPATPVAQHTGGAVQLIWPCANSNYEGFHVYRRLGGGIAEKLTDEAVFGEEGQVRYEDKTWTSEWTQVHYSVTAVHLGKEGLQSEEVMLDLSAPEEEISVPGRTQLLSIYPNPFNPETHISFELAQPGRVQIRIYDVAGRLVRTLTDGQFEAGQFEESWNGRDENGRSVPSNVYYARMTTKDVVQMRKMTLLK